MRISPATNEFIFANREFSHLYDERKRWLSETPLCMALDLMDPSEYPAGLEKVMRRVFYPEYANCPWPSIEHIYLRSARGEIVCITPGQFVAALSKDLLPGQRIEFLRQKAPNLIRVYDNQTAILYGERQEIGEKLGIYYP